MVRFTVPALGLTALVGAAAPASAQLANQVDTAISGANLTSSIGSAQGLVIAGVLILVAFTMLRKVFGK